LEHKEEEAKFMEVKLDEDLEVRYSKKGKNNSEQLWNRPTS
jgi:hypothetical protein